MDAKTQTKIRNAVKKIRADVAKDPAIRKQLAQNHIRVLAERGGLTLPEIIAAHDMWCDGTTGTCPQALTMSGYGRSGDLCAAPMMSASATAGHF